MGVDRSRAPDATTAREARGLPTRSATSQPAVLSPTCGAAAGGRMPWSMSRSACRIRRRWTVAAVKRELPHGEVTVRAVGGAGLRVARWGRHDHRLRRHPPSV